MKVGVATEIKPDEYRVALTPAGVRELTKLGHEVLVESGAGAGSAIADRDFQAQGARIVADADAGVIAPADDPAAIAAALRRLLEAPPRSPAPAGTIDRYSYASLAARMADQVERAIARSSARNAAVTSRQ